MRGQDRSRLIARHRLPIVAAAATLLLATAALAQMGPEELVGPTPPSEPSAAEPLPRWVTDDVRKMRAYPEQPPVIPHSIEGYQLTVNANRCMTCHKREFTQASGAPMISVTHYMDREGQMLADVSPRRYFCTECHVPQADVQPLVGNTFVDMSDLGVGKAGDE
ncbi:nitrate reductase cytochrome c-type subunit [Amorphus orientalis]|uniref:Periplasmic nitrate reductase, electron transfer subunit n=1 Tax=Amorphus orientalis TaxID=649198 RepID=A0AAE3VN62_9HYPH|nr:nitrate reductase cytochrome c-type subunit [Amorphus orientalis]MDQ0315022.1 cytochrome c-type protein NapB [Amorphus orientalis]